MHNFEPEIIDWRRQMIAAGIKNADVLDELESHLCEDIEQKLRAGADAGQVFETATARFGEPGALKAEFDRIEQPERKYMKRGVLIGAAIVGVMVGMALVMPAVAQYRQIGAMHGGEPFLFLIGSLLTLGGCIAGIRAFKKARA